MQDAFIIAATRTPVGKAPRGALRHTRPDAMLAHVLRAVLAQVPGIAAASPVIPLDERVPVGNGQERDVRVLGVYPEYSQVRNLVVLTGRFFDQQDSLRRTQFQHVCDRNLFGHERSVSSVIRTNNRGGAG